MSQKILLGWAITATVLMVLAVGYAFGKNADRSSPAVVSQPVYRVSEASTDGRHVGDEVPQAESYVIPDVYAAMPTEWRSDNDGTSRDGYAILLDPVRRELIVEKCHHAGYFDFKSGQSIEQNSEFCDVVLWSTLAMLAPENASAVSRDGRHVDVALVVNNDGAEPVLSLSFGDHQMELVAGSKNDLLQIMESLPAIQKQKDAWVASMMAENDRARGAGPDEPMPPVDTQNN